LTQFITKKEKKISKVYKKQMLYLETGLIQYVTKKRLGGEGDVLPCMRCPLFLDGLVQLLSYNWLEPLLARL